MTPDSATPLAFHQPQPPPNAGRITLIEAESYLVLRTMPDASVDLIYIDPPFNTGQTQSRRDLSYADEFESSLAYQGWLSLRLREAHRILKSTGSLFLHLDWREVHYAKVALDAIFGRSSFINEIVWSYDYGGRPKNRWPTKHDTILWYTKSPANYTFNYDEIDRIPYMAPSLVGEEKAARGKTPTDVWWNTIVPTNGKEKTGYPTQKPLGILNRLVRVHSNPGDNCLDFFAGSGSFGQACADNGRHVTLIDNNPQALAVMRHRFANYNTISVAPSAQ